MCSGAFANDLDAFVVIAASGSQFRNHRYEITCRTIIQQARQFGLPARKVLVKSVQQRAQRVRHVAGGTRIVEQSSQDHLRNPGVDLFETGHQDITRESWRRLLRTGHLSVGSTAAIDRIALVDGRIAAESLHREDRGQDLSDGIYVLVFLFLGGHPVAEDFLPCQ